MEQQVDVDEAMQRHYDQAEAGNRSNLRVTNRQSGGQKDQTLTVKLDQEPWMAHPGSKCLKDREYQQFWCGIKKMQALRRSQKNPVAAKISNNSAIISERNRDSPRDSSNPGGSGSETDAYWFD
ncbi:hypothetical protein J6590_008774 [Homalodisca vitripennis]|nr:hypothetical protein J6590_008774 [Homalodisca vitripennis]